MVVQADLEKRIGSDNTDVSFAELLDTYSYAEPQRGQIIPATIITTRRDEIIVDVGLKRDAIVTRRDIERLDRAYVEGLKSGDEVQVYVLHTDEDGEMVVSLNKALELEDWQRAQDYLRDDVITEGVVIDCNKGGILVKFGRLMGFVPNSHIESISPTLSESKAQDIKNSLIGTTMQLKVIQVENQRNRLILSERAAKRSTRNERFNELQVGQIVTGRVVNVTHFGVFVDIGGVDGMIHISNLDHRHITHPNELFSVGDEVTVRIDAIDAERERVALNRKVTLPDPWDTFMAQYKGGDVLIGTVTNVVDFGVFIAAPSGAQGLVHTSRMQSLKTTNPRDMFREGDKVLVKIVGVDVDNKHIELSIDDVTDEERAAHPIA